MVRLTLDAVKKRLFAINPSIEILSAEYVNIAMPLSCRCLRCGFEWQASAGNLICLKSGCPKCARTAQANRQRQSLSEVKKRIKEINPNIEVLSDNYVQNNAKLHCKCLICGNLWKARASKLYSVSENSRTGCPVCGVIKSAKAKALNLSEVRKRLAYLNPLIKILNTSFVNTASKLLCKCVKCKHRWRVTASSLIYNQTGCPRCAKKESKVEIDFLNTFEGWAKDRKILAGKELDAYFAKEKLAIEINGCYWHSTSHQRINKNYHLNKTNICESKGIKLLHFWDFEIKENFELCRQIVLENLNEIESLKDFEIKEVETLRFELYDSNGFRHSNLKLKHIGSNSYEIIEFNGPNKQNLYDFFVLKYKPSKTLVKLNRRFFSIFDNYALKLGFKLVKITKPSYFYYTDKGNKRFSKNYTKAKDLPRCYDCGNLVYERGLD